MGYFGWNLGIFFAAVLVIGINHTLTRINHSAQTLNIIVKPQLHQAINKRHPQLTRSKATRRAYSASLSYPMLRHRLTLESIPESILVHSRMRTKRKTRVITPGLFVSWLCLIVTVNFMVREVKPIIVCALILGLLLA